MTNLPEFEDDFASPLDYAHLYRKLGLQVVPAYQPREVANFKRPYLQEWRDYTKELISDDTYNEWFGPEGKYIHRQNLGIVTGVGSRPYFIVDLDYHSHPDAAIWWAGCEDSQTNAGELDTPTQTTGGGGKQKLYIAPEGWTPRTVKTSIGVDIRGVGGFAMMPPSIHASKKHYEWDAGFEPWNIEVAVAPEWFCEQIDRVIDLYGGTPSRAGGVVTQSPDHVFTPYGQLQDGREDYMTRMIWGRILDLYRECPIIVSGKQEETAKNELFQNYVDHVASRLHEGLSKAESLEKEGRGRTLFDQKWKAAKKQWDGKVSEHAAKPKSDVKPPKSDFVKTIEEVSKKVIEEFSAKEESSDQAEEIDLESEFISDFREKVSNKMIVENLQRPRNLFHCLSVSEILNMPDPVFVLEGLIVEEALGFIIGVPGCTKSFYTINLGLAIAAGKESHWGRKIYKHGPVLYISTEGKADFKFRLLAWEKETGISIKDIPFSLIVEPMNFMDVSDVSKLINTVREQSLVWGATPVAVIVDTVSRVLPGADENLQKDVTLFVAACDAVRRAFSCVVLGVHHVGRGGGTTMRGSSVFDGAGDFIGHIEREVGSEYGTFTARKIKAAPDGWVEDFSIKKVTVDLVGHTSLYVDKITPTESKYDFGGKQETGAEPDEDLQRKILSAIQDAWDKGHPWSKDPKTKSADRWAPERIHHFFGVEIEAAEKLIYGWHKNEKIITEIYNRSTKATGLKMG